MPFLRSSFFTARIARPRASPTCRTLFVTPQWKFKEDANRTPEEIEARKQEQLKKQREGKGEWHEGKGEWHESLGSASEGQVKADRQEVRDHDKHIEELQKETAAKSEGKN